MIVNHTSIGAGLTIPFQGVYNASKSAMSRFSDTLRLELQPFGIEVVELRTGGVKTNILNNVRTAQRPKLPEGTIYKAAREAIDRTLTGEWAEGSMEMTPEEWAKQVVKELLKAKVKPVIWKGESVWSAWFASLMPLGWIDGVTKRLVGKDKVASVIKSD